MSSCVIVSFLIPCAFSCNRTNYNVAVCITDKASMVFGGSDEPLALGCVYSLGKSDIICFLF